MLERDGAGGWELVAIVSTLAEAELIAGRLRGEGHAVIVEAHDAGGLFPSLGAVLGYRIFVWRTPPEPPPRRRGPVPHPRRRVRASAAEARSLREP